MNVFDLDRALVSDYERFARSFTQIRAPDILSQVEAIYASDRFWPEPLISINPRFEHGATVDELVDAGSLDASTARVFSINGKSLSLYRHQAQSVAKAATGQSFVVTTGTGSGKSLCFFIPIIDAAIRACAKGEPARTRAIIIYPMNALANSQREEIEKFIKQSGLPDHLKPTFAHYTGQENSEEREGIRIAKPDLLTNFMMLELLMTRQNALDRAVIANAHGLDFLVPFVWNDDRRAQLRAELDAWYARAYGLTRDELRYVLDPTDVKGADYPSETFRALKANEIQRFGEYRTARLVLQAWDAMEAS